MENRGKQNPKTGSSPPRAEISTSKWMFLRTYVLRRLDRFAILVPHRLMSRLKSKTTQATLLVLAILLSSIVNDFARTALIAGTAGKQISAGQVRRLERELRKGETDSPNKHGVQTVKICGSSLFRMGN